LSALSFCPPQYAVILLILILCQVCVGIAVYANQNQATTVLVAGWDASTNAIKVVLQDALVCCGLVKFNASAPLTSGLAGQPCSPIALQTEAVCMPLIIEQVKSSYMTVGVVAIVFAFLQILGLLCAICLIRGIKMSRESGDEQAQV
jgi:hypothetical protein